MQDGSIPSTHLHNKQKEKIMKKFLKSALDFIGGLLLMALVVILFWLFLIVTPDQYSAECEALREEMQSKGLIK